MEAITIECELDGVGYRLTRIDDGEYYNLRRRSVAIADDHGFYLRFYRELQMCGKWLSLARLYGALKSLSGESGAFIDRWKGSFSFPFLLRIGRGAPLSEYLLDIYDHRAWPHFGLRKIFRADESSLNRNALHEPFAEEFSREEINQFIVFLYGYLLGYFKTIERQRQESFVKQAGSELILFGYDGGEFFERQFESVAEFERTLKAHREKIARQDGQNRCN